MDIQGLLGYNYNEIKSQIDDYVQNMIFEYDLDIQFVDSFLHGSRLRGNARDDSDLDYVFEYSGDAKEDSIFNILHEEPFYIEGIEVDINPIRKEESGSLQKYKEKSKNYDKENMNKKSLYESIIKSVSKQVKKAINEYGNQLPIGFYTDEEREQQKREIEAKKQENHSEEIAQMSKIADLQTQMMLNEAPFSIIVDYLPAKIKNRLFESESIGVNILELGEDKVAIICFSVDDYISILQMMKGNFDQISGRAIAKYQ